MSTNLQRLMALLLIPSILCHAWGLENIPEWRGRLTSRMTGFANSSDFGVSTVVQPTFITHQFSILKELIVRVRGLRWGRKLDRNILLDAEARALDLYDRMGYCILPQLEQPDEILEAAGVQPTDRILTIGAATIPFVWLQKADFVQVVDNNPKQIKHLTDIKNNLANGTMETFLIGLVMTVYYFEPNRLRQRLIIDEIIRAYQFLREPERAEAIRRKLSNLMLTQKNILEFVPDRPFNVAFYTTLLELWIADSGDLARIMMEKMIQQATEGTRVLFTTFRHSGHVSVVNAFQKYLTPNLELRSILSKANDETVYNILVLRSAG